MTDTEHFTAIHARLIREQARLDAATTPRQRAMREVWVMQAKRELAAELKFLKARGIEVSFALDDDRPELSDADLLTELGG